VAKNTVTGRVPLGDAQVAMTQLAGQPSLLLLFPSSHVSPALSAPLPQSGGMIVLVVVLVVVGVVDGVLLDVEEDVLLVVPAMLVEVVLEVVVGSPPPQTAQPASGTPFLATSLRPLPPAISL
jgi:hypothetical protein